MRILQIITQGECGGAQKNVLEASVFLSKNHKIFISTGCQNKKGSDWLFKELKKEKISKKNLFIIHNLCRRLNFILDFKAFLETYKLIKKTKPHIVHVHSSKAGTICGIAAKIAGAKVVYTAHGFSFLEPLSIFKKFFYITAEFIASLFRDLTITVSKFDKKIGQNFFIIRKNKGVVIYNGINIENKKNILTAEDSKSFILKKIGLPDTSENKKIKIIGAVSNLYETKGLSYFIDACKIFFSSHKNEKIIFVVFGEGELRKKLTQKIKENNIEKNFFLPGLVQDAYKYLKGFDIVVLPSVKEGFPYIFLESLLANTSFIGTNIGGLTEIKNYIDIELVPSKNSKALADSINKNLKNNKNVKSKPFPNIFSTQHMLRNIEEEYKKILNMPSKNKQKTFLLTMPALNEEKIIKKNILKVNNYLMKNYKDLVDKNRIKICVAINGTTDNTKKEVKYLQKEIPCLKYTFIHEKGRGGALDYTWKNAKEDVFLYIDSDLSYAMEDLGNMLNSYLANEEFDMVVASRRLPGSIVKRSVTRKILTEGYNLLIKILFFNRFTDAQAGCKSITRNAYLKYRDNVKCYKGWFFDTALLLYLEKGGLKIKDLEITCIDKRKCRIAVIKTAWHLFRRLVVFRIKTIFISFK